MHILCVAHLSLHIFLCTFHAHFLCTCLCIFYAPFIYAHFIYAHFIHILGMHMLMHISMHTLYVHKEYFCAKQFMHTFLCTNVLQIFMVPCRFAFLNSNPYLIMFFSYICLEWIAHIRGLLSSFPSTLLFVLGLPQVAGLTLYL